MAFGTDDMQTAGSDHFVVALLPIVGQLVAFFRVVFGDFFQLYFEITAQHDICTATGHVGGDGYGSGQAGVGDNICLALVLLGVQYLVPDFDLVEQTGKIFRGFHRGRADQNRLTTSDTITNVVDDGIEFLASGQIDQITEILAHHRLVGRYHDDFETVNLLELEGLGIGGTGHACKLVVKTKIVLERNRRNRLIFILDVDALFRLDRLVQAFRPAATRHGTTGELVDDDDSAVLHDIVDVTAVDRVRPERCIQMVYQRYVGRVVKTLARVQQTGLAHQALRGIVP